MNVLIMLLVASTPDVASDAGASKGAPAEVHSMPGDVRALFGDLIEPVTGRQALWSGVPLFDHRLTSEIFLVKIAKEIPPAIVGVQISRLSSGASVGQQAFVVVESGGVHLVLDSSNGDGQRGVYGQGACGPHIAGLSLGSDGVSQRMACWNTVSHRFTPKIVFLPQPNGR